MQKKAKQCESAPKRYAAGWQLLPSFRHSFGRNPAFGLDPKAETCVDDSMLNSYQTSCFTSKLCLYSQV